MLICSSLSFFGFKSSVCRQLWKSFSNGMIATCWQGDPSSTQVAMNKASEFTISNTTEESVTEDQKFQGSLLMELFIDQVCNAFERYTMEYPISPLYFLKLFGIKISDECDSPWYTMKNLCITILYLAVENIVHDGMVGFNTIKYSMLSCVLIGCIFYCMAQE